MFIKSISGTCYYVTSEKMLNNIKNFKGYEKISKEEYISWCEKNHYKFGEFTLWVLHYIAQIYKIFVYARKR